MAGYGTDVGFDAWLTENGYTLPSGAPSPAVLRNRGSVYLDGVYEDRFPGEPAGGAAQERAWPRKNAEDRYGNAIASSAVPDRIVNASYQAAWLEANKAGILSKTYTPGTEKVLTKVDKFEWKVVGSADGSAAFVPISTVIEGILAPLMMVANVPGVMVV